MRIPSISTCAASLLLAACSGGGPADGSGAASVSTSSLDECHVTFHWLQKDAYANYGGRTSELWPPHTTTQVDVACKGQDPITTFHANHGSKPGELSNDGKTPFLTEVKTVTVSSSAARTMAFLAVYRGCECDATTQFLSMNALDQDKAAALAGQLATYVEQHLQCTGTNVQQIAAQLQSGDIQAVIAALSTCAWDDGQSLTAGFDAAASAALGGALDPYHVCNNDGELQSALFDSLQRNEEIKACDSTSPLCAGPRWFYTP